MARCRPLMEWTHARAPSPSPATGRGGTTGPPALPPGAEGPQASPHQEGRLLHSVVKEPDEQQGFCAGLLCRRASLEPLKQGKTFLAPDLTPARRQKTFSAPKKPFPPGKRSFTLFKNLFVEGFRRFSGPIFAGPV